MPGVEPAARIRSARASMASGTAPAYPVPGYAPASMATVARFDALAPVREKVLSGERLDLDDGIALLESDDLTSLGELADTARRLRGGTDEVYFVNNLYLNHTNVCRVKCKFCAFAMTSRQSGAYTWDIGDLVDHAVEV